MTQASPIVVTFVVVLALALAATALQCATAAIRWLKTQGEARGPHAIDLAWSAIPLALLAALLALVGSLVDG